MDNSTDDDVVEISIPTFAWLMVCAEFTGLIIRLRWVL